MYVSRFDRTQEATLWQATLASLRRYHAVMLTGFAAGAIGLVLVVQIVSTLWEVGHGAPVPFVPLILYVLTFAFSCLYGFSFRKQAVLMEISARSWDLMLIGGLILGALVIAITGAFFGLPLPITGS